MYATRDDMVMAFGERECISLTDREFTGAIDDAVMLSFLEQASAEIDSYLVARYPTPWPDAPRLLVGRCCAIARYLACGAQTQVTDEIRDRYRDAIRYLEQVARGTVSLGRLPNGDVVPSGTRVKFSSNGRAFGRDSTEGGAF